MNKLIFFFFLVFFSAQASATCNWESGLPGDDQMNNMSNVKDKVDQDASCSLIDKGGIYDDPSLQKNFCAKGCQKQIKDDQKKAFMEEMAKEENVRTHKDWHLASAWYTSSNIRGMRRAIEDKKAGKPLTKKNSTMGGPPPPGGNLNKPGDKIPGGGPDNNQGSLNPGSKPEGNRPEEKEEPAPPPSAPLSMEDFYPMTDKTLTDQEVLDSIDIAVEIAKELLLYGAIPSACHTQISAEKRKPKPIPGAAEKNAEQSRKMREAMSKGLPPVQEEYIPEHEFSPEYQACIDKEYGKDIRQFLVTNQDRGGENFLYMHHKMRNSVQMILSSKGLPCIAGFGDIPGGDGKTGDKEGSWEEIWDLTDSKKRPPGGPSAAQQLFSDAEEADRVARGLSKKEYVKVKAQEIIQQALNDAKAKGKAPKWENILNTGGMGVDVMAKFFENEDFLKSVSMNELGSLMEGSIHVRLHGTFDNPSGCKYMDKGKEVDMTAKAGCDLALPAGSHIHSTFWKLHGWCDDVIKKWMTAGDRDYKQIGTDNTCQETSCYKVKGTWSAEMDNKM